MKLRWESPRQVMARGFSAEGHQLAQIAYVEDVNGATGEAIYSNYALFPVVVS